MVVGLDLMDTVLRREELVIAFFTFWLHGLRDNEGGQSGSFLLRYSNAVVIVPVFCATFVVVAGGCFSSRSHDLWTR